MRPCVGYAQLLKTLRIKSVARRIVDGAMLHLIKMWLEAPVEETDEKGNKHRSTRNRDEGRGTPQGARLVGEFYNVTPVWPQHLSQRVYGHVFCGLIPNQTTRARNPATPFETQAL